MIIKVFSTSSRYLSPLHQLVVLTNQKAKPLAPTTHYKYKTKKQLIFILPLLT